MTPATTAPSVPHALVRTDGRRGPKGQRYLNLIFDSEEAAHSWVDQAPESTRAALVWGGFRIQPITDGS